MSNFAPVTNVILNFFKSLLKHASSLPAIKTSHPPISLRDKKPKQLISMTRKNKL